MWAAALPSFFLFALTDLPAKSPDAQENFYPHASNETALSSSSEFVLIDDFNAGKFQTLPDGTWRIRARKPSKVSLKFSSEDGRNPKRGHSLQIGLTLPAQHETILSRSLNHLDVSQANSLLLRIKWSPKTQTPPPARTLILSLSDRTLQKAEFDITPQLAGHVREWATVVVPMKYFRALDLDQLLMLSLKIWPAQTALEGNLWIDEVAFFGEGDLNFQSSRDNIIDFPAQIFNETRRAELRAISDDSQLLKEIARDTWKYFKGGINKKTRLIVDNIRIGDSPLVSGYTSPTNIAMDLLAVIAAQDFGFIKRPEALFRVRAVISTLMQMKRHKGFFFNFYETKNLMVTRPYLSSVDNGWLAIALAVVRQTFPGEVGEQATQILKSMDFDEFYDTETNQLVIGYEVPEKNFGGNHYGMLVSEARTMSLFAIGKGDLPADHWFFLFRTPPEAWKWQNQTPKGFQTSHHDVDYFQGHYEKNGTAFMPSWGGSLFEFLMPTLVLNEKKLSPKFFGLNNRVATELHRDYALKEKGYPLWGISPCSVTDGRGWKYMELGVKGLSVKGYPDRGFVTPHVTFLALDSLPKDAIANIRKYLEYPIYGDYGFYDSLELKSGKANTQYLALDQGMSFIALCNFLNKGSIQGRFEKDQTAKRGALVLLEESFAKA